MSFDSNSTEVQRCLSKILENPAADLEIRPLFPNKSGNDQMDILNGVNRAIEKVLEISLQNEGRALLIHRLRFCWLILKRADNLIRKNGKKFISNKPPPYNMKNVFEGILNSTELHECFLSQLCDLLLLDADGGFVRYYYSLLRAPKRPKQLGLSLTNSDGTIITKNLRRMIWWIIRVNKTRYVEIIDGELIYHSDFLADDVREELPKWSDRKEIEGFKGIIEEIIEEIDRWLKYSCLYKENKPENVLEVRELVKSFIKENELKDRYKEKGRDFTEQIKFIESEKVLLQFTQEVQRLEEEKRKLGDENAQLRLQLKFLEKEKQAITDARANAGVSGTKIQDLQKENIRLMGLLETLEKEKERTVGLLEDRDNVAIMGLQDLIKNVDSKYSFDVLRSVQLGEDRSVSTKNFVDHLFYSLRRKGFAAYPITEEFDLEYDQSGLYQCVGFEVPAGGKVHVKVEKRGWAFIKGIRIFPVRKAILKLA